MSQFRYTTRSPDGSETQGVESAESARALRELLEARGLQVVSIEPIEPIEPGESGESGESIEPVGEAAEPDAGETGAERSAATAGRRRASADAERLAGDLSDLMMAGVPLAQGLLALSREMPRGRYRRSLERIVQDLERGESLETVLTRHSAPRDLVALIHAAQKCGRSMELLEQYSSQMRVRSLFRNQFYMCLAYPLVLTVAVTGIFIFLLTWIVPQFRMMFMDFGVSLPAMTRVLMSLSSLLVDDWVYVVAGILVLTLAGFVVFRFQMQRLTRRRLLWSIPVVGARIRWMNLSQFARVLSILIRQRIALPEALVLAGTSTNDACIEAAAEEMARAVERGEGWESSRQRLRDFPTRFLSLMTAGEQQVLLAESLEELGLAYEERAQMQAPMIALLVEPIFVFTAGCLVGFVILSLFAPLVKLLTALS